MSAFGIPYMGSKNKIATWIVGHLPQSENLYDMFCGGCAVTHAAMIHRKFRNYYINDLDEFMPQMFVDAVSGKYKEENRWISRAEFDELKYVDPIVRVCWSFGNNWRKGYLYGKDIEPLKKAFHYALCFENYSLMCDYGIDLSAIEGIKDMTERYSLAVSIMAKHDRFELQNIENLQRLQRLQRLKTKVTHYNVSYNMVEIEPSSIIYCDIPYSQTVGYSSHLFDYESFYRWCCDQHSLVVISEYYMPDDRFVCVAAKEKTCGLSATNNRLKSIERLFVPIHQHESYKQRMGILF